MLSQRSARVTAADERAPCGFASLPSALTVAIFASLPVDTRLRCAEVCPSWRATLTERSLWTSLRLPSAASDALLLAAAARAAGQLRVLDAAPCRRVTHETLLQVLRANAQSLRKLAVGYMPQLERDEISALLLAAPRLTALHANARCTTVTDAGVLLRCEAPFAALRLRRLSVTWLDFWGGLDDVPTIFTLAADVAANPYLSELQLVNAWLNTPERLGAVVDAALARRFSVVHLTNCNLFPICVPELARLLGSSALRSLTISNFNGQLLNVLFVAPFVDALVANTTLREFSLVCSNVWTFPAVAATLLSALAGHPSIAAVNLSGNVMARLPNATAALATLVAADGVLLDLNVSDCGLDDELLGPLVDALHHNKHLRALRCLNSTMTDAFARDRLLPAVLACTSLTTLELGLEWAGARAAEAACADRRAAARTDR
jgi:hypothetical protein